MLTKQIGECLTTLFSELTEGANKPGEAYILNSGDAGLLKSLDKLSAAEASHGLDSGATIAAHAQHVRYGLSLMNYHLGAVRQIAAAARGPREGTFN